MQAMLMECYLESYNEH